MATIESPIHDNIKQAIVNADERSTQLVLRSFRNTSRMFKNSVTKEVVEIESSGKAKFEDIRHLVAGVRVCKPRSLYLCLSCRAEQYIPKATLKLAYGQLAK